jgi:hypothetical protein
MYPHRPQHPHSLSCPIVPSLGVKAAKGVSIRWTLLKLPSAGALLDLHRGSVRQHAGRAGMLETQGPGPWLQREKGGRGEKEKGLVYSCTTI